MLTTVSITVGGQLRQVSLYLILFEARNLLTKFGTVETVKILSQEHPSRFRNSKPRSSYVELYRFHCTLRRPLLIYMKLRHSLAHACHFLPTN